MRKLPHGKAARPLTPTSELQTLQTLQTLQAELRASHAPGPEGCGLMFPESTGGDMELLRGLRHFHPAEQLRGGLNPEASPKLLEQANFLNIASCSEEGMEPGFSQSLPTRKLFS